MMFPRMIYVYFDIDEFIPNEVLSAKQTLVKKWGRLFTLCRLFGIVEYGVFSRIWNMVEHSVFRKLYGIAWDHLKPYRTFCYLPAT